MQQIPCQQQCTEEASTTYGAAGDGASTGSWTGRQTKCSEEQSPKKTRNQNTPHSQTQSSSGKNKSPEEFYKTYTVRDTLTIFIRIYRVTRVNTTK